jgi:hypothetical protein
VSFRYTAEIEPSRPLSFGLIAEDVEKIAPNLVTRGSDGKVNSVRYEAVNAMLLNEFLKEHKTVQQQERKLQDQNRTAQAQEAAIAELKSTVAQQQKAIELLSAQLKKQAAQIQKVSAKVQLGKALPRTVLNNQ